MPELSIKQLRAVIKKMPRVKKEILALSVLKIRKKRNDPYKAYRDKYSHDPYQWVIDFVDIKLPSYHVRTFKKSGMEPGRSPSSDRQVVEEEPVFPPVALRTASPSINHSAEGFFVVHQIDSMVKQ